jgi:hypothetical protein
MRKQPRPSLRSAVITVAVGLRESGVVAPKVTADAIGRFVLFFPTRLAPLPR